MKKFLLIAAVCLCGCDSDYCAGKPTVIDTAVTNIKLVEYDGCEYLASATHGGRRILSHKGNCKNPIHQYNMEKSK